MPDQHTELVWFVCADDSIADRVLRLTVASGGTVIGQIGNAILADYNQVRLLQQAYDIVVGAKK